MKPNKIKWEERFYGEFGDVFPQYEGIKQFISKAIDKAVEEEREKIIEEFDILLDKKLIKKIGDNLEMLSGKRECRFCGYNPEKQRKIILKKIRT